MQTVRQVTPYAAILALIILVVLFSLKHSPWTPGYSGGQQPQAGSVPPKSNGPAVPSPTQVTIDLAAFSPTRDTRNGSPQPIHLSRRLLHMTIRLPLGMEPGEYAVQIKHETGGVYADTRVMGHLIEGTTSLDFDLNLSTVSEGRGALMICPPGQSWRTYVVIVK